MDSSNQKTCNDTSLETCVHDFMEDWIDIDPDRSQRIVYCRICEMTIDDFEKLNKKNTTILDSRHNRKK